MGAACCEAKVDIATEKTNKGKPGPVGNTTPRKGGNEAKSVFLESINRTVESVFQNGEYSCFI